MKNSRVIMLKRTPLGPSGPASFQSLVDCPAPLVAALSVPLAHRVLVRGEVPRYTSPVKYIWYRVHALSPGGLRELGSWGTTPTGLLEASRIGVACGISWRFPCTVTALVVQGQDSTHALDSSCPSSGVGCFADVFPMLSRHCAVCFSVITHIFWCDLRTRTTTTKGQ